ncbi:MAG: hypothetical protein LBB47_07760 [Spirochaetaceae bacterium]|jgi:hypothetical protein|nr:hypothetical protein [Spirochaetaceae bacterium]
MALNGFSYDESRKTITIEEKSPDNDSRFIVVWENVERNIAGEAGAMYGRSEPIDGFLHKNGCKRYWGNK